MSASNGGGLDTLTVYFDGDCGLCSWCATLLWRLDRGRRLRLVSVQSGAGRTADAPSTAAMLETMHVRAGNGRWSRGSDAWILIASEVSALRPLALLARLPFGRAVAGSMYALIARNRDRIGRRLGLDACTYRGR